MIRFLLARRPALTDNATLVVALFERPFGYEVSASASATRTPGNGGACRSWFWLAAALACPTVAIAADAPKSFKVERTADIDYCTIPNDPDRSQHLLDVFRPVGKDECPVVFFVHGGGWMIGDKDNVLGVYGHATIAASIARRGVVVVLPNYRLSPKAKHPDHIQDVALAFAWTHRHIAQYGGRPDQIFACGHSAGGHLVSLLGDR